ncbi:MAG: ankyrin repeat domain-containing protein [Actinomycetota bacterium]|nr:ankyrin repeat domain-containing protein [Actinomycetota bacterium]
MSGSLQPGDLYVHAADDGGIFVSPADRRLSAWVTLSHLADEIEAVKARSRVLYLSTEGGSALAAPAVAMVHEAASSIAVAETDPIPETIREGGVTALISAAGVGATDLLDDLIARGADLGQTADLGRTAVMAAASRGESTTLRHLLDAGARVGTVDERGDTALTLAAHFGHPDAVRALLSAGADPTHRNLQGFDARAAAERKGHTDVAALLPPPSGGSPAAEVGPPAARDRWRRLRQRMVLEDDNAGLTVRTFDALILRVYGPVLAASCLILGAATGKAGEVAAGVAVGAFTLLFFFGLAWGYGRNALRIEAHSLRVRSPFGWGRPVDLDHVRAAAIARGRRFPVLQLLQDEAGAHHTYGAQRWRGITPPPTSSDGRPLRCLIVALGPEYRRVLHRVAPGLLAGGALLDDATRTQLQTHQQGGG